MTDRKTTRRHVLLTSFFARLARIEEVMRAILSGAPLSARLTFRGEPERTVLLDFSAVPARISIDDRTAAASMFVATRVEVMHEIMAGRLEPGLAFGRRELLIRGTPADLGRFIPLLEFAPLLYKEHLSDVCYGEFARTSDRGPARELVMSDRDVEEGLIPLRSFSPFEGIVRRALNGTAYVMGYAVGILRYRFFEKLSIFEVLEAMSRGLRAAEGRPRRPGKGA